MTDKLPKRFHYHYESFEGFVNECVETVAKKAFKPEYANDPAGIRADQQEGWHGTKTIEGAFELARHGWPHGRTKLVEAFAAAATTLNTRPDYVMDVAGAYPVVPLAIAGDPACMVDLYPIEDRKRPVVRIAVNLSASCAYKAEELTSYGAACLSYIDALEANGFRVELEALVHCALNREPRDEPGKPVTRRYNLHVMAKQAHEPMELDKLAFMFVNPAFFRRLVFCQMQSRFDLPRESMINCGTAASPLPEVDTDIGQLLIPGINTFNPGAPELKSPKAAALALAPILENMLLDAGHKPPSLAFASEGLHG